MKKQLRAALFVAISLLLAVLQAEAAQTSVLLKRSAESGEKIEATLSKDVYRSVPYEDTYEEQEAYQAEETYYENIPYSDTETYVEQVPYQDIEYYDDVETYYDNEYRCRTVTEYDQQCRNERQCHPRAGEQVCRHVEECGTNAHGKRICKTRKVCEQGERREECSTRQVCHQVPRSREKCGYESVRKTRHVTKSRTVTRYRSETRTRTVTKYRQEPRTRTVTKYRTVTKCCVTRYRSEFDHKWQMNVQVQFPAEAILHGSERESFELSLKGDESNPGLEFKTVESIYGYRIVHQDVKTTSSTIVLELVPKYSHKEVGEASISKVEFVGQMDQYTALSIQDRGLLPRVNTVVNYRVLEKESKTVVAEGQGTSESSRAGTFELRLAEPISADLDYLVQLSVTRSGVVLEKAISFTVKKEIKRQLLPMEDIKDANKIIGLTLTGSKSGARLVFSDALKPSARVQTSFILVLARKGGFLNRQVKVIGTWKFDDRILVDRKSNHLLTSLGVSAGELNDHAESGDTVYVELHVTRRVDNQASHVAKFVKYSTVKIK